MSQHKLPSSCTIITQTPAQIRLPKEKYELQNEEELPVAMVRKKPGYHCRIADKDERQYSVVSQYHVIYVMILPITAGRTRILPTIELHSLPLLIKEYCAV